MKNKRDQVAKTCMPDSKVETFTSEMENYKYLIATYKTLNAEKSSKTEFENKLFMLAEKALYKSFHATAQAEWEQLRVAIKRRSRIIGIVGLVFMTLLPLLYLILNIVLFAVHWKDMQKEDSKDFAPLVTVTIAFALFITLLEDMPVTAKALI